MAGPPAPTCKLIKCFGCAANVLDSGAWTALLEVTIQQSFEEQITLPSHTRGGFRSGIYKNVKSRRA